MIDFIYYIANFLRKFLHIGGSFLGEIGKKAGTVGTPPHTVSPLTKASPQSQSSQGSDEIQLFDRSPIECTIPVKLSRAQELTPRV